jgi:type II secretory pathway component PulF
MLGSSRIPLKSLAALCRRLAIGTTAGLDTRNIWRRETDSGPAAQRAVAQRVYDAVSAGGSVGDAIADVAYLPLLFRRLTALGEQTGTLAEVYRRMAEHYEHQVQVRRTFLASLTWPLVQLVASICIVGMLIWAMGFIASMYPSQKPMDPLGLGLAGTRGLVIYFSVIGLVAAGIFALAVAVRRGALWVRPLQRAALHLPVIGGALRTMALSRFAWTLHLAMNAAMEVRQAVRLALQYTGNDYYARLAEQTSSDLSTGCEIHEALARTHAFPDEFLEGVEVAEHSGQLVESLERMSLQYDEQAQAATRVLSTIAGFLVWAAIASLIIAAIFRMAMFYFNGIREATQILK